MNPSNIPAVSADPLAPTAVAPTSGRSPESVFEQYQQFVNPKLAGLLRLTGLDVVEDHAEGVYIYDSTGKRYLDFLGLYGAMGVGHRHPRVIAAVTAQLGKMPMSAKVMLSPLMASLAERLVKLAPGPMQYAFFGNSGAEAVEGALKIARAATGKQYIVSAHGGFHGKTMGALALTPKAGYQDPFRPLMGGVAHVPYGDAAALETLLTTAPYAGDVAAMILEPIQGEGGIILPPDGYLRAVRRITHDHGVLFIADEIQSGMGRTGQMFAVERELQHDDGPDMITLAKSLGGGVMPIGAFLAKRELWRAFEHDPKVHSTTFGGNPLACAAALATLDVLADEGLLENAALQGEHLLSGLRQLQAQYPYFIREVRGRGLMIGVEFFDADVGSLFIGEMSARGVLTAFGLNQQTMIRLEPPLTITTAQADEGLAAFAGALAAVKAELEQYDLLEMAMQAQHGAL
jgi:putrescine aminotransferase